MAIIIYMCLDVSKVELFDLHEEAWRAAPSLSTARSGAVAGVLGSAVVVAGGRGTLEV